MISPIFEKLSSGAAGEKLGFYKVDVDEQDRISQEVGVKAMPTFVFFRNGEKIDQVVGADPGKLNVSGEAVWCAGNGLQMLLCGRNPPRWRVQRLYAGLVRPDCAVQIVLRRARHVIAACITACLDAPRPGRFSRKATNQVDPHSPTDSNAHRSPLSQAAIAKAAGL